MAHCMKPVTILLLVSVMVIGCFLRRPASIESVVAKWGCGSAEDDRNVVDALLTSTDGVHYYDMNPHFLNALVQKLQERPELLQ